MMVKFEFCWYNQTFNIVHCTNCVSVRDGCVIPFISLVFVVVLLQVLFLLVLHCAVITGAR